jgi:general stress protein 26
MFTHTNAHIDVIHDAQKKPKECVTVCYSCPQFVRLAALTVMDSLIVRR